MKCPYCNKEMELGFIQSNREIVWFHERHKVSLLSYEEEDVVLSETDFLRGSTVISHLCRSCEKVIIDYEGGLADYNKVMRMGKEKRKASNEVDAID